MSTTYSLWALPDKKTALLLQKVIDRLADKYHNPSFEPHMNILGNFLCSQQTAIKKTKEFPEIIQPFKARIGAVEMSTTFYQCVFLRIITDPEVIKTHLLAKKVFNYTQDHVYMPHLSLIYGDFDPSTKQTMINKVKLPQLTISFKALKLISVDEEKKLPDSWTEIGEFKLN